MEFDLFDPTEAEEYGEEREQHDGGVADVRQEDRQLWHVEFSVINQDKEQNQTNQSRHKDKQSKEKSLQRWVIDYIWS